MSEELEVLRIVIERLSALNIPYMVSGSVAMNFYGQPRMTRDIDIVVELSSPSIAEKFVQLFVQDFYIDREMITSAIKTQGMFNIIHLTKVIKIDFILKKKLPYRNEEFARRKTITIENLSLSIVTPEDLVLSKLLWAKENESEMQLKDARNIVQHQQLDKNYLLDWANKLGIAEYLQKVMSNE